jgi:transglutaminase-like putative cysteine protease
MRGLPLLCGAALAAASCGAPGHLAGDAGTPRGYVCHRGSPQIDGRLDEAEWAAAPWTAEFVDIQGGAMPAPRFGTRARMLWDDEFLYIGAWMDEPHVWGTLTEHDAVIFHDNDFEVFLDPDGDTHQYYEFEINALNTGWDLRLVKPYLDGGPALNEWEIPGLRTAVWIDGTLNDPADTDRGWSVEIALPWTALAEFANRPAPPHDGDQWRINFSRVEWRHEVVDGAYRKLPDTPEDNWVWSPQGRINMHLPEQWGYLQFSTAAPGAAPFRPDPELAARRELIRLYEAQRAFHEERGRWARSLDELGLSTPAVLTPQPDGWNARLDGVWIRQDRRIWSLDGQDPAPWWPAGVAAALDRCTPERRAVWSELLLATPAEQRRGAAFLVEHMPALDLAGLDPAIVRESLEYGYRVRAEMPWCAALPEEVFLNEVLPYAHVSERREAWRADLHARFAPLVAGCDSAAAAAQRLNETIFGELGVKYSTKRRRADQSPSESIEQGLASCTGLSILLADACRAVGVPARLAGIPRWANKPGNHTWVEVWDDGWHFTGAAEPDARGLDHAWFEGDARQALRDSRMSSIYAVSYARTGLELPMVWSDADWQVQAVNVTDRYAPREGGGMPADRSRLMVDVRDERSGERVAAELVVADDADPELRFEGTTKDEGADTNDHLSFEVPRGRSWRLTARWEGHELVLVHPGRDAPEELVTISFPAAEGAPGPATALAEAAAAWFAAAPEERDAVAFSPTIADWMARDAAAAELARAVVWRAYLEAPLHAEERAEFEARRVEAGGYASPYTLKQVGERPNGGWPLFIAMHGGGGVPKEFNDSQWEHMQIYYKDHPEAGGYLYLALRAPTDEWNGFYTDYMYPLVERLVRTLLACGEVDPGKVFLMGYSHGGYGAFAIGPKMPDLFAAVHASAAAPTPGQTTARTLRNTVFSFMVGEKDTAYGRADRCQEFAAEVAALQEAHPGAYPVTFEWQPGYGHGGLPDRDKIPSMYPHVREAAPAALDWLMTDGVVRHHFWLSVDTPAAGHEVTAELADNHLRLAAEGVDEVRVRLDHRLVDFGRPLKISAGGAEREVELAPDPAVLCRTMLERGDPQLAASVELRIGTAG